MRKKDLEDVALTMHNERHEKQEVTANNMILIKFITEQERKIKREATIKPQQ